MKVSMILATLGRDQDILFFLESLKCHADVNIKVVIIDQNADDRVSFVIKKASIQENITITHKKVDFKGLSKARNYGLDLVDKDTDILCFPDDDCKYFEQTLEKVIDYFSDHEEVDFISGKSISLCDCQPIDDMRIYDLSKISNIFGKAISYTIFLRYRNYVSKNLYFDENLGVGAKFGSTEETDFILSLIRAGLVGKQVLNIPVYHPNKDSLAVDLSRLYYYGLGVGAFLRKNREMSFSYLFLFIKALFLAPLFRLFKGVLFLNKNLLLEATIVLKSRLYGFTNYRD